MLIFCLTDSPLTPEANNLFETEIQEHLANGAKQILFQKNSALKEEAYKIIIAEDITIYYNDNSGAFYGLMTLKQLRIANDFFSEYCRIEDCPKHGIRGFILDCGRYFYSVGDVKKIKK